MLWVLNAPFAYHLARYKNLSIEDLFYGNPTNRSLEKANGGEQGGAVAKPSSQGNCKIGDKVLMSKYAGTEVKIDGNEYIILSQKDILAIVE